MTESVKPAVPQGLDPWERITVDTTDGEPFQRVLRIANFAASDWVFSSKGPYRNPTMTGAEKTYFSLREGLLHLLELGLIDIDLERLEAARFVPAERLEAGA